MQNYSKIFKIFVTLFAIGFIMWLGGTVLRTSIGYDLFVPGSDFVLKPEYSNEIRMYNVYIYVITALYTGVSYGIATISAVVLAFKTKKEFKRRGWIFMAFILFIVTIPIQGYSIYMDILLAKEVYINGVRDFFADIIQQNYIARFTLAKYTTINSISMLAALTCVLYFIWRPLDRTNDNKTLSQNIKDKKSE